jgi:hypothetical protein
MNRLTDLFEQFSLLEITLILRRTALIGIGMVVAALVATGLLGHVLIGVGGFIGYALGLANIRLVTIAVAKAGASGKVKLSRLIASNTMLRLTVTTAIVFVLAFTVRDLGLGALGGIAVFYGVFLANVTKALLSQGLTA